jgi:hypothetical protein
MAPRSVGHANIAARRRGWMHIRACTQNGSPASPDFLVAGCRSDYTEIDGSTDGRTAGSADGAGVDATPLAAGE